MQRLTALADDALHRDAAGERVTPDVPGGVLWEFHCRRCDKRLGDYLPPIGLFRTLCPRCGAENVLAVDAA